VGIGYENNLKISNIVVTGTFAEFDIEWENAWYLNGTGITPENHDAVWVFMKSARSYCVDPTQSSIFHVHISDSISNHQIIRGNLAFAKPVVDAAPNNTGILIRVSNQGSNVVASGRVRLIFAAPIPAGWFDRFGVLGIEMVQVPAGAFWAGDGASYSDRKHFLPYQVSSAIIPAGALMMADALHPSNTAVLDGNTNFPTGYNEFYCMKYEISQGQYAAFLNWLNINQVGNRYAGGLF
jgi:formylglycine-generating enzyme required for sulfatase activity